MLSRGKLQLYRRGSQLGHSRLSDALSVYASAMPYSDFLSKLWLWFDNRTAEQAFKNGSGADQAKQLIRCTADTS